MASTPFASRAGEKLDAALQEFQIEIDGLVAADLGSSTGGFVDVLLRRGAPKVYAVEKGYGRLEWRLRNDPRVVVLERTDGRTVSFPELVDIVTIDIGFVKQAEILPKALSLLRPRGAIISLIKPQYEASGRDLDRGRLTEAVSQRVLDRTLQQIGDLGVHVDRVLPSAVRGKDANVQEYFILVRP